MAGGTLLSAEEAAAAAASIGDRCPPAAAAAAEAAKCDADAPPGGCKTETQDRFFMLALASSFLNIHLKQVYDHFM